MSEHYASGSTSMRTDTKRIKWAKWLIKKGGLVPPTAALRRLMALVLDAY